MLAAPLRVACGRGLGSAASCASGTAVRGPCPGLEPGGPGRLQPARQKGGSETGPNPTDRGKPGTKRHLVTDRQGTPLGLTLSGANRHDSMMLAPTLDAVPTVRNGRGRPRRRRPRRRPNKLHADKAYDHKRCRQECRARSVTPRIARRGVESSQKLGRHRWVVERTFAWLAQFRHLDVRYERRADINIAFTKLACAIICIRQIRRFCP
ncbi:hypothetical protein M673_10120 [Aureimonas sp. AU20]|nr:hypothetical protein M673_10120 [Aureimonas sp. AU20]